MTTTTPSTRRLDGQRRDTRTVIPVPRPAADDAQDPAPTAEEWVTYPGVRYALERIDARRRPAAGGAPAAERRA
jgi:hypothetical protein